MSIQKYASWTNFFFKYINHFKYFFLLSSLFIILSLYNIFYCDLLSALFIIIRYLEWL